MQLKRIVQNYEYELKNLCIEKDIDLKQLSDLKTEQIKI
jgi:hypothetical protein